MYLVNGKTKDNELDDTKHSPHLSCSNIFANVIRILLGYLTLEDESNTFLQNDGVNNPHTLSNN
jgi:hypothetical protein